MEFQEMATEIKDMRDLCEYILRIYVHFHCLYKPHLEDIIVFFTQQKHDKQEAFRKLESRKVPTLPTKNKQTKKLLNEKKKKKKKKRMKRDHLRYTPQKVFIL